MAMRAIMNKISPSSKTSSASALGLIEGTQGYRRRKMGIDKEDASTEEMIEVFNSMSWEDMCKVNWDKYSKNKRPFDETRTEGTKEMERVILKLMHDDVHANMMRDDMHEESEDSVRDMDDA